jgi:hypothetical protein
MKATAAKPAVATKTPVASFAIIDLPLNARVPRRSYTASFAYRSGGWPGRLPGRSRVKGQVLLALVINGGGAGLVVARWVLFS